jgi:predicted NBD/HSP70 family sugar kinase
VRVRDILNERLGVPVVVQNVTNSGALAEGRIGAAANYRSFVWLYVGSGVGAGIVLDGRPFHGRQGFSGEIGHCQVVQPGIQCGCGAYGCLETVAGGKALERQAAEGLARGVKTALSEVDHPIEATDIVAAARAGDEFSRALFEQAGEYLGKGIAYLQNILNPEIVVLGGRIFDAGSLLLDPVRRSASRNAMKAEHVQIVPSVLKEQAGIVGSVLLAMDHSLRSYRIVATNSPIVVG